MLEILWGFIRCGIVTLVILGFHRLWNKFIPSLLDAREITRIEAFVILLTCWFVFSIIWL